MKGPKRVRVVKLTVRVARIGGKVLERDVIGSINIGLKYLSADGGPVALGSTGTHEVQVKPVIPHGGATPLAGLQVLTNTKQIVGKTLLTLTLS